MIDEGYVKFDCTWTHAPALPEDRIADLNRWRQRLHELGLIGFYAEHGVGYGNVSIRDPEDAGRIIISGTQTGHIAATTSEHYALVTACDIDANSVTCEGPVSASSETLTHAALYALCDDIGAVLHVHSKALWKRLMHAVPTTSAEIPYGTPAMAREFGRLFGAGLREAQVAVMAGHDDGVIAFGRDPDEAGVLLTDLYLSG